MEKPISLASAAVKAKVRCLFEVDKGSGDLQRYVSELSSDPGIPSGFVECEKPSREGFTKLEIAYHGGVSGTKATFGLLPDNAFPNIKELRITEEAYSPVGWTKGA